MILAESVDDLPEGTTTLLLGRAATSAHDRLRLANAPERLAAAVRATRAEQPAGTASDAVALRHGARTAVVLPAQAGLCAALLAETDREARLLRLDSADAPSPPPGHQMIDLSLLDTWIAEIAAMRRFSEGATPRAVSLFHLRVECEGTRRASLQIDPSLDDLPSQRIHSTLHLEQSAVPLPPDFYVGPAMPDGPVPPPEARSC